MKINLFKVLLFTFLKVIITTTVVYFLLVLVFHDSMHILHRGEEFTLMTFGEISGIVFFAILYMVSYFLPLFYICKKTIAEEQPAQLFWRFMPLVTLITAVLAFFVFLIGLASVEISGEVWINFWLIFTLSYSGLIAFVYQVKQA